MAARLTRIFFLMGTCLSASRSSSAKRSIASSRFSSWLRVCYEMTRRTPSFPMRLERQLWINSLCSGERLGEFTTSNHSVTRLLTSNIISTFN